MQLQIIATSALLGYTSAATAYGGRNKAWPAWEAADQITIADPNAAEADTGESLIGCARSSGVVTLPQKCSNAGTCTPADPGTGMAFYGKAAANKGSFLASGTARGTTGV
jgi:hypothetical protein